MIVILFLILYLDTICCDSYDKIYPYAVCCENFVFGEPYQCYFSYNNLNWTTIKYDNGTTVNWIIDSGAGGLSQLNHITFRPGFRGMVVSNKTENMKLLRWELTNYQSGTLYECKKTNITLNIEFPGTIPDDTSDILDCIDDSISFSTDYTGVITLGEFVQGDGNYSINVSLPYTSGQGSNFNASYSIIQNFTKFFKNCSTIKPIDVFSYRLGIESEYTELNCDALKTKPIVVLSFSITLSVITLLFIFYIWIRTKQGVEVTVHRTETKDDNSIYDEGEIEEEEVTVWKRSTPKRRVSLSEDEE